MLNINLKKDFLPHFVAVIVFYFITLAFFSPLVFEGKELPQHDIVQGVSGARELTKFRIDHGEEGLWSNSIFTGMPGYLLDVKYSGELIKYVHQAFSLFLSPTISLIFIAFISAYIMLLSFGVRPWLAIAGGIAFGLTEFSIIGLNAGHNSKIAAVAYMPLVLAGIQITFRGRWLLGFALTAMSLALELRVNHLQITYYLLLMVLVFGASKLVEAIRNKAVGEFTKIVGILSLAVLLSVGANIGKLWSVKEYSEFSTRGKAALTTNGTKSSAGLDKAYAFQYSNGVFEPIFLFIPNFFGGASQQDLGENSHLASALKRNGANRQQVAQQVKSAPSYWGDQPSTAPYYAGSIVIFLFVLGLFTLSNKQKMWLVFLVLFSVVLSWGKNFGFNDWMFDYFPMYNKFRSVTFVIIIAILSIIILSFSGLEKFLKEGDTSKNRNRLLWSVGIVGGFALLSILLAGMGSYSGAVDEMLSDFPKWYLTALKADRVSLLRMDALRSMVFVLLFATVIYLFIKKMISIKLAYLLMISLVLIDMYGVSKRFINADSFHRKERSQRFGLTEADKTIKRDKDLSYRVFNLQNPFNDAKTSYHHKSIGGYHGAKLGRYQDLIEKCLTPEQRKIVSALQKGNMNFGYTGVIDMLNTKYFLAGASANAVLPNPNANGNGWFVSEVKIVNSANEEIELLAQVNTKKTAVIDGSLFKIEPIVTVEDSMFVKSNISLIEYKPYYLKYSSSSNSGGLAVFSEIYYPKGWTAMIDGQEVDIIRADYVLRALRVPSGDHIIEFSFNPAPYRIGNKITLIFNMLLIIIFLFAIGKTILNTRRLESEAI